MSRLQKPYAVTDLACGPDYKKAKKERDEKERQRRKMQKKEKVEETASSTTSSEDTETSSETSQENNNVSNNNNNNNNNNIDDNGQLVDQSGDGTDLTTEYSKEFLDMETTRKWDEYEMIGSYAITREAYKEQIETTGNMDIVFAFANGNLHYGKRNKNHFNLETKKKRDKVKEDHPNDIAKSMEIHDFTSNGLEDHITLIEVNIESFSNEGFIGASNNITAILMPKQLSRLNGQPFKVFNRSMDNNAMLFLQQNPGRSHKNIKKDISKFHNNRFTIPMSHPIISVFNALNPEKPMQPSVDKSLKKRNLVVVSKKFLSEYEPITTEAMKNSISYANITGKEGPVLTFKAPIAPECKNAHQEFITSKGARGEPWLGFFHGNDLDVLRIHFRLKGEYGKCGEDFCL